MHGTEYVTPALLLEAYLSTVMAAASDAQDTYWPTCAIEHVMVCI